MLGFSWGLSNEKEPRISNELPALRKENGLQRMDERSRLEV